MAIDFAKDLHAEIIKWLPHDSDPATVQALSALRVDDALIVFLNWLGRLVHPHARTASLSWELYTNQLSKQYEPGLKEVIRKIEAGEELIPHLSRQIQTGFTLKKPARKDLGRHKDLDLLVNDWGIHHLHLSTVTEADGFVKRTGPLLFAVFTQTDAFLLDILKHGAWTNDHLVRVGVKNWPSAGLFHRLNVLAVDRTFNPDERSKLRRAGLATSVEVDGSHYVSNTFSLTTAGTATRTTFEAGQLLRKIRMMEKSLADDPDFYKSDAEKAGKAYPTDPAWRLVFGRGPAGFLFAAVDEKSGFKLAIS